MTPHELTSKELELIRNSGPTEGLDESTRHIFDVEDAAQGDLPQIRGRAVTLA